jgi:hypothetical protein
MTQMARIIATPETAKHAGVQRFNEYTILVTRHIRFRRIPPDTQQRIGRDARRGEALIAGMAPD